MEAQQEAGRRAVMIVFAVYCLPIKIICSSACKVTGDRAPLPRWLYSVKPCQMSSPEQWQVLPFFPSYGEMVPCIIRKDMSLFLRICSRAIWEVSRQQGAGVLNRSFWGILWNLCFCLSGNCLWTPLFSLKRESGIRLSHLESSDMEPSKI